MDPITKSNPRFDHGRQINAIRGFRGRGKGRGYRYRRGYGRGRYRNVIGHSQRGKPATRGGRNNYNNHKQMRQDRKRRYYDKYKDGRGKRNKTPYGSSRGSKYYRERRNI